MPLPSLGDLPDPGAEPTAPALQADSSTLERPGKFPREGRLTVKTRAPRLPWLTPCGLTSSHCSPVQPGMRGSAPHGHSGPRLLPPVTAPYPRASRFSPGPLQPASRPGREPMGRNTPPLDASNSHTRPLGENQSWGPTSMRKLTQDRRCQLGQF